MQIPSRLRAHRLEAFVLSWAVGGVLAIVALTLYFPTSRVGETNLLPALLFLGITAISESVDLRLKYGKETAGITLVEAAVAATILLFPADVALGVILGGILLVRLAQRQQPLKLVFNLGQYAAATSVAIIVFHLLSSSGESINLQDLGALAAAMLMFGALNMAAVDGVIAIIEDRRLMTAYREGVRLSAISVMGNSSIGVIAAVLWQNDPIYLPLLVIPAFTIHLAYRGVVQGDELLKTVRAERDRLDQIIESASEGVALVSPEGLVEVWSPSMEAMTGKSFIDALGKPISEVLQGVDTEGSVVDASRPLISATASNPIETVEMILSHPSGEQKVVQARHSVLFDERGALAGDVLLLHDVTRQREVERLKDDFIARVSHELRTPLTPIKGFAQTLIRRGSDIPEEMRKEALESILERSDHMARLIEDLLLLSRISAGRASMSDQVSLRPFDCAALCERLVSSFRPLHAERDIKVEATGETIALADPTRADQIVANLLSNAFKYSEDDAPVYVRVGGRDGKIAIEVQDRGRGIPPSEMDRIFQPFHRVEDPNTMTTGGIGIGLYISYQLAEAMDGSITVDSKLGEGSTFILWLPAAEAQS